MDSPQKCVRSIPSASHSATTSPPSWSIVYRPGGRGGLAVAAAVVAQDAEVASQFGHLRVPHRQVGAQRVAEGQPGRVLGAVDAVVQAVGGQVEKRHGGSVAGKGSVGREHAVDPGVAHAAPAVGGEQRVEVRGIEDGADLRVFGQHLAQMAMLADRALGGGLDQRMRGGLAERGASATDTASA